MSDQITFKATIVLVANDHEPTVFEFHNWCKRFGVEYAVVKEVGKVAEILPVLTFHLYRGMPERDEPKPAPDPMRRPPPPLGDDPRDVPF